MSWSHIYGLYVQIVKQSFTLGAKHQAAAGIQVYACSNSNDTYTTASTMRKIGILHLVIKDPTKVERPRDYSLTVGFSFGASEFKAVARDDQTGEEVQTNIVFIAD